MKETEEKLKPIIGLSESEAKSWCAMNKLTLRVVSINGKPFACTAEFRDNRVNVYLDNNKVVLAFTG